MNSFSNIKDPLIIDLNKSAVESRSTESNMVSKLKTFVKVPVTNDSAANVYGRSMSVGIPRHYNNLQNIFIKCTLTCTGDNSGASAPQPYFGTRIFKEIRIRTKNGTTVQLNTPTYSYARIDELFDSPLYNQIAASVDVDGTWNNSTVSIVVPIFSWINNDPIQTCFLEPMELAFVTNTDKGIMGLSADITAATYEVCFQFNDDLHKEKDPRHLDTRKMLINYTDVFQEPNPLTVLSGATTCRMQLTCQFPVFVSSFMLTGSTSGNIAKIRTMVITTANTTVVDMDFRNNYTLEEGVRQLGLVNSAGPFTYWWGRERSRKSMSGLMSFMDVMYPVWVTLTFDAIAEDMTLNVVHEYPAQLKMNDAGQVRKILSSALEANVS